MILFKKMKSAIFRHFELCYWYRIRKITELWFDDEDTKWKNSFHKTKAKNILESTWNGEGDLWRTMLLKIDHEFWNLHKYGVELNYYFSEHDIEKYASDDDKEFIVQKILNSTLGNNKKLWLFNGTTDKKTSESGLVHFSLEYNGKSLSLVAEYDKEIPKSTISKRKKLYELNTYKDENGKIKFDLSKEAPQFEVSSEIVAAQVKNVEKENLAEKILNEDSAQFEKKIKSYLQTHSEIDVNEKDFLPLKNLILKNCDECGGFEIAEIPKLSMTLKAHAAGNFVKCKQLLHLRHLVKKLLSVSDNIHMEEEMKERQDLYKKIFDFMSQNGMKWRD